MKAGEFGKDYPVVREWTTKPLKLARAGDVLICVVGATAGKLNLGIDCAIGRSVAAIRPFPSVESKLIYRQLLLQVKKLRTESTGSAQGVISKETLSQIEVVIPPEQEQRRIADKLDTVLARVDAVNERLARVAPLLKRLRQSVLAAATSGRLTEDWRSIHAPSEWVALSLGEVLDGKPRNGYSPKAVDYPTPVRSLTLAATTSGKFRGECCKFIDEQIPEDSHLWLQSGDVLIQRANSLEYVGVSAVFDGESGQFIYPDLMMKAKPDTSRLSSAFLHVLLSCEKSRQYLRNNATGTAGNMPKINQQTVMSLPVLLPEPQEQTEIVRRVELLFAYADRLEARLSAAQTAAERLTPALLAKAFRGELVPQDPLDEPAAELLRRLQSERSTAAPAARGRGRKAAA